MVALKSYCCGMPIYSLTRDSVSRYSRPLRCCIRNKMSRSANAKYHYILPFSIKYIKETYLGCIPVFFGVNSSI